MLVKAAFDPGFGHYEIFGIAGFGHETVYPNVTIDRIKFGGQQDIVLSTAAGTATNYLAAANSNGSYTGSIVTGGMGASARVPVIANKLSLGAKGLFGPGVGRYAQSNLSDVTSNASGALTPIHNAAGLLTVEATPTPRLLLYLNYGGEYAGREDYSTPTATTLGSPKAIFCPTSATEAGAFTCTAKPTTANIAAGGAWGGTWTASTTQQPVGYGSHFLSNSACTFVANPGLNGSSTGYYPGTSCGAQTRDVQEITGGYWFDIYKGDHGRLRQGFQYSYAVREGWSGLSGIGAKGVENMFFTSFRYYLP
jgi:hypothetical protein